MTITSWQFFLSLVFQLWEHKIRKISVLQKFHTCDCTKINIQKQALAIKAILYGKALNRARSYLISILLESIGYKNHWIAPMNLTFNQHNYRNHFHRISDWKPASLIRQKHVSFIRNKLSGFSLYARQIQP